jgi:cytochrome c oxidase cbb3-type subunit 3
MKLRPLFLLAAMLFALSVACRRVPTGEAAETPKGSPTPPQMLATVGPIPGPVTLISERTNPYTHNAGALADGKQLFNRFNCAGCHGDHGGGGMGPSLRDVDWIYGSREAQIFSTIAEGRAHGMPSWGRHLNEDQIWKLVTYIKSMRTADEPDPPR